MSLLRWIVFTLLWVGADTFAHGADVIYDSQGFEHLDGLIDDDGLDGWYSSGEGIYPLIWPGPPSKGAKSVVFRVYMADGLSSGMWRNTEDLIALGYQRVTVYFDVYRPSPEAGWFPDFLWGAGGGGNPMSGGQSNMNDPMTSRTYPFVDAYQPWEFDSWLDAVVDDWAAVELTWDFEVGIAFGFYNGVLVTEKAIDGIDSISDFSFVGEHGGAPDLWYEEEIWIDNFVITAEKNRCYPDFTGDGLLDLFDFLAYVNAFNAGDAEADCDKSVNLDLFDFLCFVNAFNEGC